MYRHLAERAFRKEGPLALLVSEKVVYSLCLVCDGTNMLQMRFPAAKNHSNVADARSAADHQPDTGAQDKAEW